MAILEILHYPDPRLRNKAVPVEKISTRHTQILDDMLETMYRASGIGLAATQVNIHEQMIVMDISEQKDQPLYLINPQIIEAKGHETMEEGCLSVPGVAAPVERADWIKIKALDKQGEAFELETDGLMAVCIQHEMDHLKGKLFVDYLSRLKRERIRKKIEKTRAGK